LSSYTSQGQGQELNWKPLDFISLTAHQTSIFVLWDYSGLNLYEIISKPFNNAQQKQ